MIDTTLDYTDDEVDGCVVSLMHELELASGSADSRAAVSSTKWHEGNIQSLGTRRKSVLSRPRGAKDSMDTALGARAGAPGRRQCAAFLHQEAGQM
jgi:hypothetical protein